MKRFGFFNSINGDRKYLASDISEALDIATTTGIKQEEGVFEVTPYEDMTVKINPGSALVFGCFYSNDEDELIKLDMADGELNRIDRIVIRYDRFDRSVDTVVLKGANALNPTPPTPLRNENQFDLVLADIYIRKATTEILASDITDMRESELCGYIGVKGAVSQLEFDRHLTENVVHLFEISRDLTVLGKQELSAPFTPKGAIVLGAVSGSKKMSIGVEGLGDTQGSIGTIDSTGNYTWSISNSVYFSDSPNSRTVGRVYFGENKVVIDWQQQGTGGTATGSAKLHMLIFGHGK